MPIYEYQCGTCGRLVETLQKADDAPPKCFYTTFCKGPMRKLMSQGSFVLKGKGWYKTDYQDKPDKKNQKS
jgi:putative FmdB family regulatory protein